MSKFTCNCFLLIFLTSFGLSCSSGNQNQQSGSDKSSSSSNANSNNAAPNPIPPKAKDDSPDLILNTKDYAEEYQKDRAKTDQKYSGKTVEISAIVTGMETTGDTVELFLKDNPEDEKSGAVCRFEITEEPWNTALPGQKVILRGKVSGIFPAIQLEKCRIISATGPVPPSFTPNQLANEFTNNREEFEKKYKGKYMIVTGKITSLKNEENYSSAVLSQKDSKVPVTCYFMSSGTPDKERNKRLKIDQEVRIIGICSVNSSDISFGQCQLLKLSP